MVLEQKSAALPAKPRVETAKIGRPAANILNSESKATTLLVPLEDIVLRVVTLAQTLCEKKFYPYQVQFTYRLVESILERDGETITALLSRQSGKTEGLGGIILAIIIIFPVLAKQFPKDYRFNLTDKEGHYRGFKHGVKIGIYAPKLEQSEIMFNRVRGFIETATSEKVLKELKIQLLVVNGNTIKLSTGSRLICQTASENAKIEGETHHVLVLEEAQDMSDLKIKKSLRPMVASTKGTICMIGTATTKRCMFYDMIKYNERAELSGARRNHFFYPHDICSRYNSLYAEYIEQEKQRLGEMSDEFQMSYGCKWIFERGMFITPAQLFNINVALGVDQLFSERHGPQFASKLPANYSIVAGIDWASVHDSTVVTTVAVDWLNPVQTIHTSSEMGNFNVDLYRRHVLDWAEWTGDDYETQFSTIYAYLMSFGRRLSKVVTDSNSCGKPIYDRLVATFASQDVEIVPVNFTPKAKSDGYKSLFAEICGKRVTFPAGKISRQSKEYRKFTSEILDLRKTYSNGLMKVAHPEEKNAHDDYPDSLMLANWGTLSAPINYEVDFSDGNPFFSR